MLDNSQVVESILSIQHTGTHESYMNLITGTADFILVAREPSADELVAAAAAGVALDTRAVALDAFVFLVNAANPRDDFSLDEIRAIYSGAITSWTALGVDTPLSDDPANPIQPYIRDPNSGSQELMDALVMRGTPMIDAPDMLVSTMIGLINVVGQDTAGIGYSVFYYAVFIAPDELVALVAIDGVPPTSETIADGTYPLVTEVYAVVREDMPDDSAAVRLRDWLLTPAGQAVVAESGYVPITE
jgi:phosphate transport system substrate-binding protein